MLWETGGERAVVLSWKRQESTCLDQHGGCVGLGIASCSSEKRVDVGWRAQGCFLEGGGPGCCYGNEPGRRNLGETQDHCVMSLEPQEAIYLELQLGMGGII